MLRKDFSLVLYNTTENNKHFWAFVSENTRKWLFLHSMFQYFQYLHIWQFLQKKYLCLTPAGNKNGHYNFRWHAFLYKIQMLLQFFIFGFFRNWNLSRRLVGVHSPTVRWCITFVPTRESFLKQQNSLYIYMSDRSSPPDVELVDLRGGLFLTSIRSSVLLFLHHIKFQRRSSCVSSSVKALICQDASSKRAELLTEYSAPLSDNLQGLFSLMLSVLILLLKLSISVLIVLLEQPIFLKVV